MSKRRALAILAGVAALVFALLFFLGAFADDDVEAVRSQASSDVAVSDARIEMPPVAGSPAAGYFTLTNRSDAGIFITEVSVEHAASARIIEANGPAKGRVANVHIEPGQTVNFTREGRHLAIYDYNSSFVPGAQVRMTLTLGTAEQVTVPVTIEAGGNRGAMDGR